ncbi:MAG: transglycosylase SLT domain-containing protein [Nitrospirota bacterium]
MIRILMILLICLFLPIIAGADIYRYVDENGIVCYTNTPFMKKAERVIKETNRLYQNQKKAIQTRDMKIERDKDYHKVIYEKAVKYEIDPSLVKAIIKTESNWNQRAVSRKGAMGLMQLMPATASEMALHDPFNPEENIEGGTRYLRYLLERFNGDLTLALAAYNAGPKTIEIFGTIPPITETRQYVNKVLSLYNGKATKKKRLEPIYKVVLQDGTILFTNSPLFKPDITRF